jgi:epoxyqueuosine reductase
MSADDTAAGVRNLDALASRIAVWGRELGFGSIGIADTDLAAEEVHLLNWLRAGRHGEMHYMARHGVRRSRPSELIPGTVRVITARLDYWPGHASDAQAVLDDPTRAYVSRYALGRDYHKVLRSRLQQLAERIAAEVVPLAFVGAQVGDVVERELGHVRPWVVGCQSAGMP